MPARAMLSILVFLLAAAPSLAAELRGTCDVRFEATTTFKDFSGTGSCRPIAAPLERNPDGHSLVPVVEVTVSVAGMATGIDGRDKDMRKMLGADQYPEIRGSARGVDIDALRERMRADPQGRSGIGITLSIRGVEREIPAVAGALKEEGGRASFDIEFPVSLKDFGIDAPRVFGFVRVGDVVSVKTRFEVEMAATPQ